VFYSIQAETVLWCPVLFFFTCLSRFWSDILICQVLFLKYFFLILSRFFERDTQGHGAKERHCRLTVRFLLEKCVWVVDLCSIFYHITI
jgi:hypothetical protein